MASLASRHRRRSVPSFASGLLGGRGKREGSVDPLLEGFQSDGGDSGGRQSNSTFHRSVSRGDLDAMDRYVVAVISQLQDSCAYYLTELKQDQ